MVMSKLTFIYYIITSFKLQLAKLLIFGGWIMKTGSEELKEQKKIFLETAAIIDEILKAKEREDNGEEVDEKEAESLMGRYLFKIVELATVLSNA